MKTHRQEFRVMFSDCDPAQIVFYPNFCVWFDRATQSLFNAAGLPWTRMFPDWGLAGIPLVDIHVQFRAPAAMDDEVQLESHIEEWRDKIFVVYHRVTKAGELVCEGRETRAWAVHDADAPKGIRAASIPDEIKAKFED